MLYVIGIVIGLMLGLTGAGGSLFAVPLLVLFLDLSTTQAMGVALGAVSFSALYGVLQQRKFVLWMPGFILAAGGMLTAPVGKLLATSLNDVVLLSGFSALATAIALRMWHQSSIAPEASRFVRGKVRPADAAPAVLLCRASPSGTFQLKPRCISGLFISGLVIGFLSGLFGVGGGFLIVPFLLFLSQVTMPAAIATSLFIIVLVSATGFVTHLTLIHAENAAMLVKIIVAGIGGMMASRFFSDKFTGPQLQKIFAVLLICVSLVTLAYQSFWR